MRFVFLFALIISAEWVFGQKYKTPNSQINFDNKEFLVNNPPNCRLLYDNVFIDETEITNLNWLEYLYFIKKDSSQAFYKSQKIDSTHNYLNSLNKHYLQYPGFRMYPVVGTSYEQAKQYCRWRSNFVNAVLPNSNDKKYVKQRKLLEKLGLEIYYEYRLPTITEWEYAANGGLKFEDFPHGIINKFKKIEKSAFLPKGQKIDNANACLESLKKEFKKDLDIFALQSNVKEDYWTQSTNTYKSCSEPNQIATTNVYNFAPNNFELYDMIGNVTEMISEKGISKGGSFKDSYDSFNIRTNFDYTQPEIWLGFRCICVVHFRKIPK